MFFSNKICYAKLKFWTLLSRYCLFENREKVQKMLDVLSYSSVAVSIIDFFLHNHVIRSWAGGSVCWGSQAESWRPKRRPQVTEDLWSSSAFWSIQRYILYNQLSILIFISMYNSLNQKVNILKEEKANVVVILSYVLCVDRIPSNIIQYFTRTIWAQ